MYGPFPSCPKPLFQSEAKCIIVCDIEKKTEFLCSCTYSLEFLAHRHPKRVNFVSL